MARNDSHSRNLTSAQRAEVFDKTAANVTKKYFDPRLQRNGLAQARRESRDRIVSIGDPEEFELAMHDLVRKLGTSHTGFFHQSVRRVPGRLSIGASFRRAERRRGHAGSRRMFMPAAPAMQPVCVRWMFWLPSTASPSRHRKHRCLRWALKSLLKSSAGRKT